MAGDVNMLQHSGSEAPASYFLLNKELGERFPAFWGGGVWRVEVEQVAYL